LSVFFSDVFSVPRATVEGYGAFDISLFADLPLFIDPFLLFNSKKPEYQALHEQIIGYIKFLRDKSTLGAASIEQLRYWYCFPEVKQNWFGFSKVGNGGSGLGVDFARSLHGNLHAILQSFGDETITKSSHLEKVCLIKKGVGKDNISDFTTNLIKDFLYRYTERFAEAHISRSLCKRVAIERSAFNYSTESWESRTYNLPWHNNDHIVLTPIDMLTRDDTWINRGDMVAQFATIPKVISNEQLRFAVQNYFQKRLSEITKSRPKKADRERAIEDTLKQFPELIDYFILLKEKESPKANKVSAQHQKFAQLFFAERGRKLLELFLSEGVNQDQSLTYDESLERAHFLRDVIENKGGHRIFYDKNGQPFRREEDVQIMYRLVWFGSMSNVTREANDGRGPVDFKVSFGAKDVSLIEFKLASNTQLKRNLQKQLGVYKKASSAHFGLSVITYFTAEEFARVRRILKELQMDDDERVILIDARKDNKPSGSKA
jgi:hypothetical protein